MQDYTEKFRMHRCTLGVFHAGSTFLLIKLCNNVNILNSFSHFCFCAGFWILLGLGFLCSAQKRSRNLLLSLNVWHCVGQWSLGMFISKHHLRYYISEDKREVNSGQESKGQLINTA